MIDFLNSSEASGLGRSLTSARKSEAGARFKLGENALVLDDDDTPMPAGSLRPGRLAARGRVPLGYYKDPAKTAATFPTIGGVRYAVPGDYDRPEKRNAFSPEMIVRLVDIWQSVAADPAIRVVLLTGAGTQAFSAGGDLGTTIPLMMRTRQPVGEWEERFAADRKQLYAAILRGADFFKPVVAAINGHALAGGAEMTLGTDIRVMSSEASIGITEVRRGLIAGGGSLSGWRGRSPGCRPWSWCCWASPFRPSRRWPSAWSTGSYHPTK